MNLLFKFHSINSLIRLEGDCDCPPTFIVHHGLRQTRCRIERHAPLDAAFSLEHHGVTTFSGDTSKMALRKKSKEHGVRVGKAFGSRLLQLTRVHRAWRRSALLNTAVRAIKCFDGGERADLLFFAILSFRRVPHLE